LSRARRPKSAPRPLHKRFAIKFTSQNKTSARRLHAFRIAAPTRRLHAPRSRLPIYSLRPQQRRTKAWLHDGAARGVAAEEAGGELLRLWRQQQRGQVRGHDAPRRRRRARSAFAALQRPHRAPSLSPAHRREFVQEWLPRFREQNPQLAVEEVMQRGRHPFLAASYRELSTAAAAAVGGARWLPLANSTLRAAALKLPEL
jgi:hypothetical protein